MKTADYPVWLMYLDRQGNFKKFRNSGTWFKLKLPAKSNQSYRHIYLPLILYKFALYQTSRACPQKYFYKPQVQWRQGF